LNEHNKIYFQTSDIDRCKKDKVKEAILTCNQLKAEQRTVTNTPRKLSDETTSSVIKDKEKNNLCLESGSDEYVR
jgi:hypothetical protein